MIAPYRNFVNDANYDFLMMDSKKKCFGCGPYQCRLNVLGLKLVSFLKTRLKDSTFL